MVVEFSILASPQVTFTAACTHSIRGSMDKGSRITSMSGSKTVARINMARVATRALEKVLRHHHMPSLAAGDEKAFGDRHGRLERYLRSHVR